MKRTLGLKFDTRRYIQRSYSYDRRTSFDETGPYTIPVKTTVLTFEGRYPYIPPVLFSPTEPKILEMLTMAALLQLSGSSGESAAALRSNGISAWNTVTITKIDQFLLFYFVSSYHSQNKKRFHSLIKYVIELSIISFEIFIINAFYIYTLYMYYLDRDNDILVCLYKY